MDHSNDAFLGEVRLVTQRRVSHGLGLIKRDGLTPDAEFRRELAAYLLVLPPSAVFTHLTGALLRGWKLPKLPEQVPVFVAVKHGDACPRRAGLICSRIIRPEADDGSAVEPERRFGLPVESPEEILLRAARDLGLLDMVILVDSARKAGDLDPERMEAILASGRPGVRMLREAWRRSTGKAESAPETLLQQFHLVMEVPFTPQAELFTDTGQFIARVDLLVDGTTDVHEYDGEHHRGARQHRTDLRRERDLRRGGYHRRGFVLDDLLNHPVAMMQELDRLLGRSADPRRIARWRALVENSLYSESGRERLMNRWRRRRGILDWANSA